MFKYEHKRAPLLPVKKFYHRVLKNLSLAFFIILISLVVGIGGYMALAKLDFADALQNAAMILGGMGPVNIMPTDVAKYFASFYALFSGITFLSTIAVLVAPVLHRAMHKFHLETETEVDAKN